METNLQIQKAPAEFKPIVEEDIEKRKLQITDPVDVGTEFTNIMSSTNQQEIDDKGVKMIGNTIVTPSLLNSARTDEDLRTSLFLKFKNNKQRFAQKIDQPIIGLSSSDLKEMDDSSFDTQLKTTDRFKELVASVSDRQAVAKVFGKDSKIPLKGRQLIVDRFETGNIYTELSRAVASIPGDVLRLPNLLAMVQAGARAAVHGVIKREDGATGAKFAQLMNIPSLNRYNQLLNSSVITRDAASRVQQWYKDTYIKEYGEDAYKTDHQMLSFSLSPEGNIIPNVKDGQPVYETRDLDMGVAADLLDVSYNKLTGTEKSSLFFASIAPITIPSAIVRASGANKLYQKVLDERKMSPEQTRGLTDYDVLQFIKNKEGNKKWKYWRKAWQTITLSKDKNKITEGANIQEHNAIIARYDDDITTIGEDISSITDLIRRDKLALKKAPKELLPQIKAKIKKNEEALNKKNELLGMTRDAKISYTRKAGYGGFDNPYFRATIADDVIVSSAMGYGSELYGYLFNQDGDPSNERYAELFIGISAPILAPGLVSLAKTGVKFAGNVTGIGEGTADFAMAMQNATWLPMIKPGDLYNGDEVKFKKIIARVNAQQGKSLREPTKDQLESFRLFSKIFKNMRPEFREKSYQSILRYNKAMDTFEEEMRKIFVTPEGIPDEQLIAKNMAKLQLSMAEVTGLAPLIAYSNRVGNNFSSSDAVNNIDELTAMALVQEDKLNGISTLLDTIKGSIKQQTGMDLNENTKLSETFNFVTSMIKNNKDRLSKEKQHLMQAIDIFEKDIGITEINTDTINTIVRLKQLLADPKSMDYAKIAGKGNKLVNETYENLVTQVNTKLEEITANVQDLSEKEVRFQVRRVADVMFDLEYGRKRAEASGFYTDVNNYALNNNIKVDFKKLIKNYINANEELKGKPLKEIFGSGSDFINTVGIPMKKAFNKMAANGLRANYSKEALNGIRLSLRKQGINVDSDLDLALYLADNQESVIKAGGTIAPENVLNFFEGTVSEAEDVMRYFRDKALYSARIKNKDTKLTIADHIKIIDDILVEAGGTELLEKVQLARGKYSSIVGETTDTGYGFEVIQNRTSRTGYSRKDRERIDVAEQGNYLTRIDERRPEAVFYNIANLSEKYTRAKSRNEKIRILQEITDQKNRAFHFLGGSMTRNNDTGKPTFAFDITKPRQKKLLEMTENLMNLVVTRTLRGGIEEDAKKIKKVVDAAKLKKYSNFDQIQPENYNFVKAMNIIDIENKLAVPVIVGKTRGGQDIVEYRKLFTANDTKQFTIDLEELLQTSKKTREEYDSIRNELYNAKSPVRIAAQKKVDDDTVAVQKLENLVNYVKDPKRFFKEHFQNATVEDIDEFILDLTSQGMSEAEAQASLKYMYMRGIFELSGETKTFNNMADFQTSPIRSEITDVQSFVNLVLDGKQQAIATKVLGHDSGHVKFLEDMAVWVTNAGANPRGFAPRGDTKGMTIDNVFSRIFNLARGMVSPLYVGTEIATRLLLERNQTLLSVALKDKDSARILAGIIRNPDQVTDLDIKTLARRAKIYLAMEVIQNKNSQGVIPTLSEFIGRDEGDDPKVKLGIESEQFTQEELN